MKTWLIEHQQLLSQQIETERLPHAILISGVVESGKKFLGAWLVEILLCQNKSLSKDTIFQACGQCKACHLNHSKTYPDNLVLSTDNKSIGVDDIRHVSQFLEKTAHIGNMKTVLIPAAEKMTTAAANALLKTLEEPTNNSIIVLLTADMDILLPTIISRCRIYSLRPSVGQTLLASIGGNDEHFFANISHLPELTDQGIKAEYHEFTSLYINYLVEHTGRSELLSLLNGNPYALRWLEKTTVNLMRTQHQWQTEFTKNKELTNKVKLALNHDTLWLISQLILAASKQIKIITQVNSKFLMEKLLIDIFHTVQLKGE